MTLSENRNVDHFVDQELRAYPVAAGQVIYQGAFVGVRPSGFTRGLKAGDPFVGLSYDDADNADGENGDEPIRVYTMGDFSHAVPGVSVEDVGRPVFASDDNSLTLEAEGNSAVGRVLKVLGGDQVVVRIDTDQPDFRTITHAVEDLSGGEDLDERAIGAFGHDAWILAARLVNQATEATGINNGNPSTVTLRVGGQVVASRTFDASTPFPPANEQVSLGPITRPRAATGEVLTLTVTNGGAANPGPFIVEVEYA